MMRRSSEDSKFKYSDYIWMSPYSSCRWMRRVSAEIRRGWAHSNPFRLCGCLLNMRGRGCARLNNVSLWADLFISPVDNPSDNVRGGPPSLRSPHLPFLSSFCFCLSLISNAPSGVYANIHPRALFPATSARMQLALRRVEVASCCRRRRTAFYVLCFLCYNISFIFKCSRLHIASKYV